MARRRISKFSNFTMKLTPLQRRAFFESLGFFFSTFFSFFILNACKFKSRSKFEFEKDSSEKNSSTSAPTAASNASTTSDDFATQTKAESCSAAANNIDWKLLPDAGENLEPYYKFYGDSSSSLIALALPKYQHGNLIEIYLVRSSGKLLAQKGLVEQVDINPDTTLRPIVFDNIQLKSERKLVFIFKTSCKDCLGNEFAFYKYEMPASITFSDQLFGKKVFSPTPSSIPAAFSTYQSFGLIGPDPDHPEGFSENGAYLVASSEALFTASALLKGCVITDMAGALITQNGENFNNILNFPEFICYRLVDNQYYIRTFIKVL